MRRWVIRPESRALPLPSIILVAFFDLSRTAVAMCVAGVALFVIAAVATRREVVEARGLDKIVAVRRVCYSIPLAVFGALHLFGVSFVIAIVPPYMPWRLFWAYAVGCALIAAAVSIATNIAVRWSGLLFGLMMFLFVALIHLPGAIRLSQETLWVIVFRELSFGGAGWILASQAPGNPPGLYAMTLRRVGVALITATTIFFGVEHFLHPTGLPGVPLPKQIPAWVPLREVIDYITGAGLLATGASVLLTKRTRIVAASLGAWLLLMLLVIYGPVLIGALSDPGIGVQVEGINYFADTLLFTGTLLALASADSVANRAR
jgi:uncharacterized membrane protein